MEHHTKDGFVEESSPSLESSDISSSKSKPMKEKIFRPSSVICQSQKLKTILLDNKNPVSILKARQTFENWSDESFSQTQSETEQSDVECRVHALKEELKRRRLIADRLKKEQKKKKKEHLRAQEASLKNQIEAYDAFIKSTQQELSIDFESASNASGAGNHSAKPQIRSPRKSEQNQHICRSLRNSIPSFSPDASPRAGSQKHAIGSLLGRQQSDSESSGRSSRSLSFDDEQQSPDDISISVLASQSNERILKPSFFHNESSKSSDNFSKSSQVIGSITKLSNKKKDSSVKSVIEEIDQFKTSTFLSSHNLEKDTTIPTEDEVSEQLSEISSDHTKGSLTILNLEKDNNDDDKTPVVSPLTVSASSSSTPTPDNQNTSILFHDPQPVLQKRIILTTHHLNNCDENSVQNYCNQLLSNLLKDSLDLACSIYKSSVSTPFFHYSKEKSYEYNATNNILLSLTNELINDSFAKVLSIKNSHKFVSPSQFFSAEQDVRNEMENYTQSPESRTGFTLTRPVSPVFGTSQDAEEWMIDTSIISKKNFEAPIYSTNESVYQMVFQSEESLETRDSIKFFIVSDFKEFQTLVENMIIYLDEKYDKEQLYSDNIASYHCFDCTKPTSFKNRISSTFQQSIFDLVRQLLREIYFKNVRSDVFSHCILKQKKRSFFHFTSYSKLELLKCVKNEVTRLFGFVDSANCMKANISLKWGNLKKKDNVDLLLIEELREEETKWTDYDVDESAVKVQLSETVFDLLLNDTINCLSLLTKCR